MLAKAEAADSVPLQDGLTIPAEVSRRQDRLAKLQKAVAVIEVRAKARREEEMATHRAKRDAREARVQTTGKKPRGREPQPPKEGPAAKEQYNFTDPESRIMKAGSGQHFEQSYNAQAAVEIESRLIVARHVTDAPNDKQQLVPTLGTVSPGSPVHQPPLFPSAASVVKTIAAVLVDSGYYSEAAVAAVEAPAGAPAGPKVYAATGRQPFGRLRASGGMDAASPNSKRTPTRPRHRPGPPQPNTWPTGCKPRRAAPSARCANKPSNPFSAS